MARNLPLSSRHLHPLTSFKIETKRLLMARNKKTKAGNLLARLVSTAEKDVLGGLILELSRGEPEVRRKCFEYLKKHVVLAEDEQREAEGEALMALWTEVEPDLSELDEYGGGLESPRIGLLFCSI
jgi:hypothetical protein